MLSKFLQQCILKESTIQFIMTHREYVNKLVGDVLKMSYVVYSQDSMMFKHIKHMTSCLLKDRDKLYCSKYSRAQVNMDMTNFHFNLYHQKQLWLLRRHHELTKALNSL